MARSMTAYGRAHAKTEMGLFLIEIHSVNRKSLDIHLNLPKDFLRFDMPLRQRLGESVKRGHVTVRMSKEDVRANLPVVPQMETMQQLHQEWQKCASELGYDAKEAIPFSFLLNFALTTTAPQEISNEELFKQLKEGFEEALKAFLEMKENEGCSLLEDMYPRLEYIENNIQKVRDLAKNAPKRYYDKLVKRLEELKGTHQEDEERLARELVIFTDKVDITEEITRLYSHTQQFREILASSKIRVGRELDFLIQEMNREANTIATKSQELEITQSILSIKSELEKIREQLQNIE